MVDNPEKKFAWQTMIDNYVKNKPKKEFNKKEKLGIGLKRTGIEIGNALRNVLSIPSDLIRLTGANVPVSGITPTMSSSNMSDEEVYNYKTKNFIPKILADGAIGGLTIGGATSAAKALATKPVQLITGITGGVLVGEGINQEVKNKGYESWGDLVNKNTGLDRQLSEWTNPGYAIGGRYGSKYGTKGVNAVSHPKQTFNNVKGSYYDLKNTINNYKLRNYKPTQTIDLNNLPVKNNLLNESPKLLGQANSFNLKVLPKSKPPVSKKSFTKSHKGNLQESLYGVFGSNPELVKNYKPDKGSVNIVKGNDNYSKSHKSLINEYDNVLISSNRSPDYNYKKDLEIDNLIIDKLRTVYHEPKYKHLIDDVARSSDIETSALNFINDQNTFYRGFDITRQPPMTFKESVLRDRFKSNYQSPLNEYFTNPDKAFKTSEGKVSQLMRQNSFSPEDEKSIIEFFATTIPDKNVSKGGAWHIRDDEHGLYFTNDKEFAANVAATGGGTGSGDRRSGILAQIRRNFEGNDIFDKIKNSKINFNNSNNITYGRKSKIIDQESLSERWKDYDALSEQIKLNNKIYGELDKLEDDKWALYYNDFVKDWYKGNSYGEPRSLEDYTQIYYDRGRDNRGSYYGEWLRNHEPYIKSRQKVLDKIDKFAEDTQNTLKFEYGSWIPMENRYKDLIKNQYTRDPIHVGNPGDQPYELIDYKKIYHPGYGGPYSEQTKSFKGGPSIQGVIPWTIPLLLNANKKQDADEPTIQKYQKGKPIEIADNKEYFIKDWLSKRKHLLVKNKYGIFSPFVNKSAGDDIFNEQMKNLNNISEYEIGNNPKLFKSNNDREKKSGLLRDYADRGLRINTDKYSDSELLSQVLEQGVRAATNEKNEILYFKPPTIGDVIHERTHGLGADPQESAIDRIKFLSGNYLNKGVEKSNYFDSSDEILADLYRFRHEYKIDPTKVWTLDEIKTLQSKYKDDKLLRRYNPKMLFKLFNDVAQNNNITKSNIEYA